MIAVGRRGPPAFRKLLFKEKCQITICGGGGHAVVEGKQVENVSFFKGRIRYQTDYIIRIN